MTSCGPELSASLRVAWRVSANQSAKLTTLLTYTIPLEISTKQELTRNSEMFVAIPAGSRDTLPSHLTPLHELDSLTSAGGFVGVEVHQV